MRGLMVLVVAMGVLIVAGTAVVGITIVRRMAPAGLRPAMSMEPTTPASLLLDEPAGSHIVAIAPMGERLAILLQGGGPDRLVVFDDVSQKPVERIALRR